MTAAIAIFVKTPALSPVKTRLSATIGTLAAQQFYKLSLDAVRATVRAIASAAEVDAYWAVAEADGLSDPLWKDFPRLHTGDGDLGQRQHRIYEALLARHERVLLIGADAPQISEDILEQASIALDSHDFVIGPARDGGYYLFGGKLATQQKTWTSVPWSTNVTRQRLESALPSNPAYLPMLTDVDAEEDLQFIGLEMPRPGNDAQQRVLQWMDNLKRPVSLRG